MIAVGLLLLSCQSASAKGFGNGKLNGNPSNVAFGNTMVGSYQTSTVVLTNSGGSDVTINNATLSGAGFAIRNNPFPLVLAAGTSTSMAVTFAPPATGSFSGSVAFSTTGSNHGNGNNGDTVSVSLSGDGITPGTLAPNATGLSFGSVQVGNSASLSETLTNAGGTSVSISTVSASGTGFGLLSAFNPVTLAAGPSQSLPRL